MGNMSGTTFNMGNMGGTTTFKVSGNGGNIDMN